MEISLPELPRPLEINNCSQLNEEHHHALRNEALDEGCSRSGNIKAAGSEPTERRVIEESVAQVFGVEGIDLRRATRGKAKVARARQVAMYLAHVGCGMSLTDVGRTFDRDRTTVSHACGVVEDGRDDPTFDRVLELLEQVVHALLQARGQMRRSRSDGLFQ